MYPVLCNWRRSCINVNALEALESRGFKPSPRLPYCLRLDVISLFLIIEWCYHCPVDVSLTLRVVSYVTIFYACLCCKLIYVGSRIQHPIVQHGSTYLSTYCHIQKWHYSHHVQNVIYYFVLHANIIFLSFNSSNVFPAWR
jgi:hypothetical protein